MMTALFRFSARVSLFLIILSLAGQPLAAQKKTAAKVAVTGNVLTTDGKPAQHITVMLKDTFFGALTDAKGQFNFEAVPGKYTMVVSSIASHKKEREVEIVASGVNFFPGITIIEDAKVLEQIVITGQFEPQSLHNSVYKVKVIDSRQIERKAAPNVQSLLNTEIGVRLSNDMALGETDFEIMGMSGNNVKVLVDGVPVIDRGANKQSLSQMDIGSIDRVEIVEGPMSVVYGTDALAGVINIITKKPELSTDKNIWTISAAIQEESAGDEYRFIDGRGVHRENIQLSWAGKTGIYAGAGFTRNTSGGWKGEKTNRERMWQPKEQFMYNGTLGYKKNGFNAWYRLDYMDEEIDTPINATAAKPQEISNRKYLTDRINNQLQADWKINNKVSVNAAASYQQYERRTRTTIKDTDTGEERLSEAASSQDTSTMKTLFFRTSAVWKTGQKLTLQPGLEYQWTKGTGARIEGSPSISDFAVYLSAEWSATKWLKVRPGLRRVLNSEYDAPFAIPSLQTKFALNRDMDLRLSYGYGFRAPTIRELYMSFHNDRHEITGNLNLKAENSNNLTASFTWRIIHQAELRFTSTLSGFYNNFRDRIETIITDMSSNPIKATYGNVSKYKTVGGTLENSFVWKNLNAGLGVSLVGRYNELYENDSYSDAGMKQFRFSPEVSANVSYRFDKSGTELSMFYKFTGKRDQYYISNNEIELRGMDSYHWADFTVGQKLGEYLKLSASVKNIFNITMVENSAGGAMGSSGGASFVGCGRSYSLGVSFLLNK